MYKCDLNLFVMIFIDGFVLINWFTSLLSLRALFLVWVRIGALFVLYS